MQETLDRYVKATLKDLTNYQVEVSWGLLGYTSLWPQRAGQAREGIESPGRSTTKW